MFNQIPTTNKQTKPIIKNQGMINTGKIEITKIIRTTEITTRTATMKEMTTSHKPKNTSKRSQLKKNPKNNQKKIVIIITQTCCLMIVIIDLLCHVNLTVCRFYSIIHIELKV